MIEVVGLTARGWADLPERLRELIGRADVVLGGGRHLGLLPAVPGQRRIAWPSPLREELPALLAGLDGLVVALASGDPLVAGIGGTLVDLLGADAVRIHPAVSSVALARARMGWPEESVAVIRLRGGDLDLVRRELAPGRRLIVLSADAGTPQALAALLVDAGFGASRLVVLGDLGGDAETRTEARPGEWRGPGPDLHLVCVECVGEAGAASWAPGLPDAAYDHDGQLTKRDVRATALARLQPRPGELLWDVGAGAGSVAIEWARAHPTCRAIAVERDPARAERIARNAAALGVPGVRVVLGEAPAALAGLPRPGAVFVGGGASAETLAVAWSALPRGGRLVAHGVTVQTEAVLVEAWRRHGGELNRIAVEHLAPLGRYQGWTPARAVVAWSAVR